MGATTRMRLGSARWVLPACLLLVAAVPDMQPASAPVLEVFTRPGCPRCSAAREYLQAQRKVRPELQWVERDVAADPAARARLDALARERGVTAPGVPAFFAHGRLVFGFLDAERSGAGLRALMDGAGPGAGAGAEGICDVEDTAPCTVPTEVVATSDWLGPLSVERLGFPAFTVALGLLDGFNPCAMWVLLFLLSLLVNLQDRRRMALIAGTFVVASGAVYYAFMAAWLSVFALLGLSRAVQVTLGAVAAVIGVINVKEFFAFRRGVSLTIPEAAKPGLYARMRGVVQARSTWAALAGAVVLAVLVNVVELLCTAGFPAIYTSLLARRDLPWWGHHGYLLLYNAAYMADDALMATVAVITLGHRRLQEKEGRWLKLVSGVVMVGLAVALLFRPDLVSG